MIPVIDLEAPDALDRIDEAYSTVGFAVFTNALPADDKDDMSTWQEQMKSFFDLPLEIKQQYPYEGDTNLGYSMIGDENVDPTAPKDIKESFNYNDTRMSEHLWPDIDGFKADALSSISIADRLTLRILEKFDTILDTGTTLVDACLLYTSPSPRVGLLSRMPSSA